ncbi:hypothetical protein [Dactylosporangium salmoneum]|uniref:Uncharacterized protein n=1 Tax=Dactylosporangium salmoneum TaxID=53361 RepID=A0ABN3H702_9ACTN
MGDGDGRGQVRLPVLQVQFCLAVGEDRGRAVTAVQQWFREGFAQLGRALYDPATRLAPAELHVETRLARRVPHAVSIMLAIPQRGVDDYLFTAYSPALFDALVESLVDVPIGAHVSFTANDADGDTDGSTLLLDVDRIDSDAGTWLLVRLLTLRTPFAATDGMAPLLAFVRSVANLANPMHGEIAWGNHRQESVFELAIAANPKRTLAHARQTLRGYSWLTILPEEIGQHLGGLDALRSSGAFVEVEHLDAGGFWCRATPSIMEYDWAAAERVFQVVAPALPPGQPNMRRVPQPNALSARNAAHLQNLVTRLHQPAHERRHEHALGQRGAVGPLKLHRLFPYVLLSVRLVREC